MRRAIAIGCALAACAALALGCGGPSTSAPPSTSAETTTRPVRIDDPAAATGDGEAAPRPVRVAPTVPGEVPESDELASPPPVEAPTGP